MYAKGKGSSVPSDSQAREKYVSYRDSETEKERERERMSERARESEWRRGKIKMIGVSS